MVLMTKKLFTLSEIRVKSSERVDVKIKTNDVDKFKSLYRNHQRILMRC